MTLKYESEILFDLMKRDGDDAPSDVLPYESELKEKYLEQVEGAYPKLQDYRSEWLNYNLNAHLPADFPVETLSNVTKATVDNVVPYAYGSAILKGQTLVNNLKEITLPVQSTSAVNIDIPIITKINQGERYYAYVDIEVPLGTTRNLIGLLGNGDWQSYGPSLKSGINKVALDAKSDLTEKLRIQADNGTILRSVVLMKENVEFINQFWGMKSVQMPVLSTVGKNLFDGELELGTFDANGLPQTNSKCLRSKNFLSVSPNTNYVFSNDLNYTTLIFQYDKNKNLIEGGLNSNSVTTRDNTHYLKFRTAYGSVQNDFSVKYQLEKGSTATPYEPHKSNILTVNEEVTLCGIGDVQDELDLMTGEFVEKTKELELNTAYNMSIYNHDVIPDTHLGFTCDIENNEEFFINGYYVVTTSNYDLNLLGWSTTTNIYGQINKSLLKSYDTSGLIDFFSNNEVSVIVRKAKSTVKTVDLTVTDQDGNIESIIRPIEGTMHVSTSSQTLPPLLDMSVPVEAMTQNLMSFANIVEGE